MKVKLSFIISLFSCNIAAAAQAPIAGVPNPIQETPNQIVVNNREQAAPQPKYYDGYDSEDEERWDYKPTVYPRTGRNAEKVMIPFFRGVHFFRNHFPEQKKIDFLNSEQVGDGVFSTASFDVLQLDYTEQELSPTTGNYQRFSADLKKEIRQKALEMQTSIIRKQVIKLKDGQPITVDGVYFQNPQIGLYYLYVKSYARFLERLKDKTFLPREALDEFIAVANPIASAAEIPDHAIRYAAGLKIAGQVSRPEFDATGKPKNPYLGKVYAILVPQEEIQKLGLFRVLEAYAANQMPVNCRIVNECEAAFPGGIPGQYVVNERVIRVPNFKHVWSKKHELKYGLTSRMYNNLRKEILETKGDISQQETVYEKLIKQLINHNYRQGPSAHTLSNQLLEIAQNEAWMRKADMKHLDFNRLPTAAKPAVADAKRLRRQG